MQTLPDLPYPYEALEPVVDRETMYIHHTGHHKTYVSNLNEALADNKGEDIVEIHKSMASQSTAVRNNGGGHYNHSLFWRWMAPVGSSNDGPADALKNAIEEAFGSVDAMKSKFTDAAKSRFGSGWAWLGVKDDGTLAISSTPNQDNPLMQGIVETEMIPILGLDVWEHAYYLKYRNKRPDYIQAWWKVVNWKEVSRCYEEYAIDPMFSTETAKMYAESLGLPTLSEDVLQLVTHDVEYRIRELLQEASKHMRHSRRTRLTVEDINNVLALRNEEQIYGYDSSEIPVFKNASGHWLAIEGVQPQIPENPLLSTNSHINSSSQIPATFSSTAPSGDTKTNTGGGTAVKHHLSKEHQLYFETITSCLMSSSNEAANTALNSLRTDAGIQQLLPYLIQFVAETLHQIMPTLLTLVIGRRLFTSPAENHWSLRDDAAAAVASICRTFGDAYADLVPRVLKTLLKVIDTASENNLPSLYGAIVCIKLLGKEAVEAFLLPNVRHIHSTATNTTKEDNIDAIRTENALLTAVGPLIYQTSLKDEDRDTLVECFGDKLTPFLSCQNSGFDAI